MCLQTKVLDSLHSGDSEFFFLLFQKKWVGRAMGNETFYMGMAKQLTENNEQHDLETFPVFH